MNKKLRANVNVFIYIDHTKCKDDMATACQTSSTLLIRLNKKKKLCHVHLINFLLHFK